MASGIALGAYSSALVLSDVAAIQVNGKSATTRNPASGSQRPMRRFCQVSSPTISGLAHEEGERHEQETQHRHHAERHGGAEPHLACAHAWCRDRKSTRLNSSHGYISYAVFCLKNKKNPH